ncbi:MAG: RimK/LysX family protein [Candidatus Saccharibacteria bacterium]|nr:RimK/LysX family protein [Candidatus Saccharibacteria bacterium]
MPKDKRKVVGSFETILFTEFNNYTACAKIDTGAYTGALHCTKVFEEKDSKGRAVLKFSPFDHPEIVMETRKFSAKDVKSSNGSKQERYFIKTKIKLQGVIYPITISLADRAEMRYEVLIGRRFLQKYNFLVDVNRGKK